MPDELAHRALRRRSARANRLGDEVELCAHLRHSLRRQERPHARQHGETKASNHALMVTANKAFARPPAELLEALGDSLKRQGLNVFPGPTRGSWIIRDLARMAVVKSFRTHGELMAFVATYPTFGAVALAVSAEGRGQKAPDPGHAIDRKAEQARKTAADSKERARLAALVAEKRAATA